MKKTLKLKKNYEFKKILTKGKYYSGRYLDVFVINSNQNINRIGIAVGVKVAKAVKRNRIKRLIYENYRLLEDKLDVGYKIIFLWKKKQDIKEATFYNIKEDMTRVLTRIGILS
ncbi:MAG: ribonuclease P protein component [Clostridia bacterium]|nr:ribonuclease P protein component [Clostridia bacterium]